MPFLKKKLRMETEKETEVWYAMRATYRREPDAMRLLEKEKLDCFVPMQYREYNRSFRNFCLQQQAYPLSLCRMALFCIQAFCI